MSHFLFVIDTTDYAGNFEREMCAYVTGHIGDCGVGSEMVALFEKEVEESLFDNIFHCPDENGCSRPTAMWLAPNGDSNSVAIFFGEQPTSEQIALMRERAFKFVDVPKEEFDHRPRKILGFRLLEKITTYNEIPV